MTSSAAYEQLEKLHSIILEERECAKKLNIDGMMEATKEKERLISTIDMIDMNTIAPENKKLADLIRRENRRNAYLFWAALNWIRDTMEFFGRQVSPASYSSAGRMVTTYTNGRLLSGKV